MFTKLLLQIIVLHRYKYVSIAVASSGKVYSSTKILNYYNFLIFLYSSYISFADTASSTAIPTNRKREIYGNKRRYNLRRFFIFLFGCCKNHNTFISTFSHYYCLSKSDTQLYFYPLCILEQH